MIPNSLVVAAGKGGVGKTTLSTHLAGVWAAEGRRTLLVDLDPQATATRRLAAETDRGSGLLTAYVSGRPVVPVANRELLDVVPAGDATHDLSTLLAAHGEQRTSERLTAALEPVASDYDIVVIDSPPSTDSQMAHTAQRVAGGLVGLSGPTPNDLEGIDTLRDRFGDLVARGESTAVFLGVVLFQATPHHAAGALVNVARRRLEADGYYVFDDSIREARAAIAMAAEHGLLVTELAEISEGVAGSVADRIAGRVPSFPKNLPLIAGDFIEIAGEVWARHDQARRLQSVGS